LADAPTEAFPCNVTNFLEVTAEAVEFFVDYLAPLILSSTGVIGVIPDGIGYGESSEYNRVYLSKPLYGQAAVVSYVATQDYIQTVTGGCTELSVTISIHGYGQGGYAAVAAAKSLQAINVDFIPNYVSGAPLDLISQLEFSIQELLGTKPLSEDTLQRFRVHLAFVGYGYSSDLPFLANTGSGQNLLDDQWLSSIRDGLSAPDPMDRETFIQQLPFNPAVMINQDLVSLFEVSKEEKGQIALWCHRAHSAHNDSFC
jgi:hypothetical protein